MDNQPLTNFCGRQHCFLLYKIVINNGKNFVKYESYISSCICQSRPMRHIVNDKTLTYCYKPIRWSACSNTIRTKSVTQGDTVSGNICSLWRWNKTWLWNDCTQTKSNNCSWRMIKVWIWKCLFQHAIRLLITRATVRKWYQYVRQYMFGCGRYELVFQCWYSWVWIGK